MSKKFILPVILMLTLAGCATPSEPEKVTVAEALEIGAALETGKTTTTTYKVEEEITSIKYAWDDEYKNISFYTGDLLIYRVKMGENINCTELEPGVKVTCEGKIKNNGENDIQLVEGYVAALEKKGDNPGEQPTPTGTITSEEAMNIGSALGADETTTETYKVAGKVTEIKYPYNEQYNDISFYIGQFLAYQAKFGSGISHTQIVVGADVVVEGTITNYKGNTVEMVKGTIISATGGNGGSTGGDTGGDTGGTITSEEAMNIGSALGADETTTETYKVAGKVTEIKYPYSEQYNDISFYIGQFLAFQAKFGSGVTHTQIVVGADVVIEGTITNYKGNTVEMVKGTIISATGGNGGSTGGDTGGDTGGSDIGGETTGAHSIAFDFAAARTQVPAYDASLKDTAANVEVNGYTYTAINCYNSSNASVFMLGSKKYASPALVALAKAIPGSITEVVITFPKDSSKNADYNVSFGASAFTSPVSSNTTKIDGVDLEEKTVIFKNTVEGATYFALSCVNTKYNGQITKIEVFYN